MQSNNLSWSVPEATLKTGLQYVSPEEVVILAESEKIRESQYCIFKSSAVAKAFRDFQELINTFTVNQMSYVESRKIKWYQEHLCLGNEEDTSLTFLLNSLCP